MIILMIYTGCFIISLVFYWLFLIPVKNKEIIKDKTKEIKLNENIEQKQIEQAIKNNNNNDILNINKNKRNNEDMKLKMDTERVVCIQINKNEEKNEDNETKVCT